MQYKVQSFRSRVPNVHPRVWGKGAWIYLHSSALTYPSDDDRTAESERRRDAFRQELRDLPLVVPCSECRGHLAQELSKVNIDAIDSYDAYNSLILWLHNQVRERQGKSAMTASDVLSWLQKEGLDLDASCEACEIKPMRSSAAQEVLVSDPYKTATFVLSAACAALLVTSAVMMVRAGRLRGRLRVRDDDSAAR